MKKITLLILTILFSFTGYSQFTEGFESSNLPNLGTNTWDLGTGGLNSNGIWGVFDNGVGLTQSWKTTSAAGLPYEGANAAFVDRENVGPNNTSQDFLATPLITVPANGELRFFTRKTINGNFGTVYKIMVAPSPDSAPAAQDNPAAYTSTVQSYTEVNLVTTYNVYEEKIIDLSTFANQKVYIAFVREYAQPNSPALSGDRWLVDKVRVFPKCQDPAGLAAGNISQTSATLSWTNPSSATQWEVQIIPFAATFTGVGTVVTTNPYVATTTLPLNEAFTPTTQYKYYVRALCGTGIPSAWIGPFAFTTSSPGLTCASPIVIGSTPYSTTDTTANYGDTTDVSQPAACAGTGTNYMTGNDVFYSYTPTASGAISITMAPTGTWSGIFVYDGCANVGVNCVAGVANGNNGVRDIPNLPVIAGHQYIIVISTNATPQAVGYSMVIQTLSCPAPTGLAATGTGEIGGVYSANLSWNAGTATSWQVFVQTAGSQIPVTAGVTANTNTNFAVSQLTGTSTNLTLGQYQYWVRSDCGDGTFSSWAGPYLFHTTSCATGCTYKFIMTDSDGDGWNGNTMTVSQGGVDLVTLTGPSDADNTNPITANVPLCDGPFQLKWNAGGNFAGEVGISIVNSFNQTLYVKPAGTGAQNTVLYTGVVDCATAACLSPTNLSATNFTVNSATLAWNPGGPEGSWQVMVLPAGSPAPAADATGWMPAPTNPFNIGGLAIATSYDFYVRAVCSGTQNSIWAGPFNFHTSLCEAASQCNYTFTQVDSYGDGWNGGIMTVVQNGLVVATLTGPTDAQNQTPIPVQVSLCNGVPFDLIWTTSGVYPGEMGISITGFPGGLIFNNPPGTAAGLQVDGTTTPLFSETGQCVPQTCLKPTNIIVSNIGLNSIQVAWTDNNGTPPSSWDILVLPATAPAPLQDATGYTNVTTNPFVFGGLDPATKYKVYVRAVCSTTDSSFWSLATTFNTQICLPSNLCEYTFIMNDSDGDGWNGNTMNVTQNGIVIATLTGPTDAQNFEFISQIVPLCNNVPFELFWNTGGTAAGEVGISILDTLGDTLYSHVPSTNLQGTQLFTGTVTCVPVTCLKPIVPLVSNVSQTSALLSWTETGSATQWRILILPAGSPAPLFGNTGGIIANVNPILITGLLPGTSYVYYVRAVCAATDLSNWSVPKAFTTLVANDDCSGAIFVPVNSSSSCDQSVAGTLFGATGSTTPALAPCTGTADDDVWFQFVASNIYHNISFNNVAPEEDVINHALYTGGCGGLTLVYCSTVGDLSTVANNLTVGQTYYVRVWSNTAAPKTTTFDICVSTQSTSANSSAASPKTQ
jgi:hypothetical protein